MIRMRLLALLVGSVFMGLGCAQIDPIQQVFDPATDSGNADFSVLGVVGNTLSAGFTNGGLLATRQAEGYSALIAKQLGKTILTTGIEGPRPDQYVMPGYGPPGSPGTVALVNLSPPTIAQISPPGSPANTGYPSVYNALAVPGAKVGDALRTVTSNTNPFFDLVLRGQGTMLQQLAALRPTFVIFWLGPNDVLCGVTSGQTDCLTPVSEFDADYRAAMAAIQAIPSVTGAVVANIPDVLSIPFMTTVPPFVVNPLTNQPVRNPATGALVPLIGPRGPLALPGAGPGDRVAITAIPLLTQGIGIPAALGGTGQPLPDAVVLHEDEQAVIRQRTVDLNEVIATVAGEYELPVVDAASILAGANTRGVLIGGLDFTADFIQGGLFSLDGVHPWTAGYGIAANGFIRVINAAYGSNIPLVNYAEFLDVNWKAGLSGQFNPFDQAQALEAMFTSPYTRAALNMD